MRSRKGLVALALLSMLLVVKYPLEQVLRPVFSDSSPFRPYSALKSADLSKPALIACTRNQLAQYVIGSIALGAAFVNRVDDEVSSWQC
jgi:hypothetical protein